MGNFWKELKRRKVVHVITVYAAVSFVLLQLVDIVERPLRLPDWTTGLVIVLLCIGFIIAVFVSWVYDKTPSGVKKTKPVSAKKHSDQATSTTSSGWKIATYASSVIIIGLVAFNFTSRINLNIDISKLDKSIAVLPFINDSPDTTNTYFINGLMDKITTDLQMVKGLRVVSRTSVEKYRNRTKSIPEIAKELDVNYIVEGNGQKYGSSLSIDVKLIKAKGKETHLWSKSYGQEIKEVKDYIRIQSQIALSITAELKLTITTEEKQRIEKTPTASLTAYDFYQQGRDEYTKYWINGNRVALLKAESLYRKALKYDSTFAQTYSGLASLYFDKHYWESFLSEDILDSVLILCNNALFYDDQLSEAYTIRGDYFREIEVTEQAVGEYDKALKFNPNDPSAYWGKGLFYQYDDHVKSIENLQKAITIDHGPLLPNRLRRIGNVYQEIGFIEKAKYYYQEAFKLDNDSIENYWFLADLENDLGNFTKRLEFLEKINAIDSTYYQIQWWIGINYMFQAQSKVALKYFKQTLESSKNLSSLNLFGSHRIGWAYCQNGYKKEAEYYFNEEINYCNRIIKLGRVRGNALRSYYDLASVYAFKGEKEKAYKYLRIWATWPAPELWMLVYLKNDPFFNSIRNEPEFQHIVGDMQAKNQAEHERVRKWLEEQGML